MRLIYTLTDATRRGCAAAIALSCLAAANAAAGPSATVSPVIISAATFPQPLAQALPSVSVITRVQIEQSGIHNLTTLLTRVAGVQITANGGPRQPATT